MFFPMKEMKHCHTMDTKRSSINSSYDSMNQQKNIRKLRLPMICRTDLMLKSKDNQLQIQKIGKENNKKYTLNFKQKRVRKVSLVQNKILNSIMQNQIDRWEYSQSPNLELFDSK